MPEAATVTPPEPERSVKEPASTDPVAMLDAAPLTSAEARRVEAARVARVAGVARRLLRCRLDWRESPPGPLITAASSRCPQPSHHDQLADRPRQAGQGGHDEPTAVGDRVRPSTPAWRSCPYKERLDEAGVPRRRPRSRSRCD